MKEYYELLKNPLWINKRKRIILRDGKQCTVCGIKKKLQVHHTFYYTDYREPWRYPDESLLTLCKDCHQKYHEEHELKYKEAPSLNKGKGKTFKKLKCRKVKINNIQNKEPLRIRHKNGSIYRMTKRKIFGEIKEVWRKR